MCCLTRAVLVVMFLAPLAFSQVVTDKSGDTAGAPGDLLSMEIVVKSKVVQLKVKTTADYPFSNTQILIDTDRNGATGFAAGGGFDLMVEGSNLFIFKGSDQTQWGWQAAGQVNRRVKGDTLIVDLPKKHLGGEFDCIVRSLDGKYAEVDRVPDTGVVTVNVADNAKDASGKSMEKAGDATDATRDITSVRTKQKGGDVVIEVENVSSWDFAQLLVFFDADGKRETGFHSSYVSDSGFDYLLNGGRVHRFAGKDPASWSWEPVCDARVTVTGKKFTAVFDGSAIATDKADVVAMSMSADWQTAVDVAPDDGVIELTLDKSKLAPPKKAPVMAKARKNRNLPPRKRFEQAKSFYCYYGGGQVPALSHYDIMIGHSPQLAPADIAKLKDLGVVVVGYITVGEDENLRKANGKGPGGYASWYFDEDSDGEPDQNGIWKSYYANANDPAWREDRVEEAGRLLREEGYDGIFLDTLDTASAYPASRPGMIKLVKELREALPDAPIVLNQGFHMLKELAPLADGMMIESFTATYDFRNKKYVMHTPSSLDWTKGVAEKVISPAIKGRPFQVLVLDYALPGDTENIQVAADRAVTFGYLFAAGPITLDAVYDTGITGKYDAKWFEKQATPESMKYVLDRAANGFPKGTVLVPSGCYSGYKVAPLVDGVKGRESLYWADAAWASAEDGEDAWLKIQLPEPQKSRELEITWNTDNGRLHASQDFKVEVLRGGKWDLVERVSGNDKQVTRHSLPNKPIEAIRILQPAGGGSRQRPALMWIAQVRML